MRRLAMAGSLLALLSPWPLSDLAAQPGPVAQPSAAAQPTAGAQPTPVAQPSAAAQPIETKPATAEQPPTGATPADGSAGEQPPTSEAPTDGSASEQPPAEPTPSDAAQCASTPAPGTGFDAPACQRRDPPRAHRVPDVASMKTPTSPAFMALGVVPSEIQRPSTPSGLQASVSNGFANGTSLAFMQNFALELSPFWLFPHHSLSYEDVLRDWGHSFYRNLSISAATSPDEVEITQADGSTTTLQRGRAAVGARTTILPGTPTATAQHCYLEIKRVLQSSTARRDAAERDFLRGWEQANPEPPPSGTTPPLNEADYQVDGQYTAEGLQRLQADTERWLAERQAFDRNNASYQVHVEWLQARDRALQSFTDEYEKQHPLDAPAFQRCLVDIHSRKGVLLEAAWALSLSLPDGDWKRLDDGATTTHTLWITPGLIGENLLGAGVEGSLVAVLRYRAESGAPSDTDLQVQHWDAGARLGVAFERFGGAVEGTLRQQQVDGSDDPELKDATLYRIGITIDYRLESGIWLTGSFGKDFGDGTDEPLIALANLQWNFDLERRGVLDSGVRR